MSPVDPAKSPIFVVGTSRSGTTLLRMMLCAHPRIYLTHEASFYLWESVFPWRGDGRGPRGGAEAYLHYYLRSFSFRWLRLDPRPILAALPMPMGRAEVPLLYTSIMRAKAEEHGKVRFGDKTPSHSARLRHILRDFPDARIVRIVRDPREVVASFSRMPWASRSIVAGARRWRLEHEQVAPFRDRILELRLEDLLVDTRAVMMRVLDFVGEPWSDQVLDHDAYLPPPGDLPPVPWFEQAAGKRDGAPARRSKYCAPEIRLIERLCRKGMAEMGYAREKLEHEPTRLAVFQRWLADLPELIRFTYFFALLAWMSRKPDDVDSPTVRALFKRLNPRAWEMYPGFEMPFTPALPSGWDQVRGGQTRVSPFGTV